MLCVAANPQPLDVLSQQCHLNLLLVSAEFPAFPLTPSAFIPFCLAPHTLVMAWEGKLAPFRSWMSRHRAGAKFKCCQDGTPEATKWPLSLSAPALTFYTLKRISSLGSGGGKDMLLSYSVKLWENKHNTSSHNWACWALLMLLFENLAIYSWPYDLESILT